MLVQPAQLPQQKLPDNQSLMKDILAKQQTMQEPKTQPLMQATQTQSQMQATQAQSQNQAASTAQMAQVKKEPEKPKLSANQKLAMEFHNVMV